MKKPKNTENPEEKEQFPGYPHYPQKDDIYQQAREESELDPEDPTQRKKAEEFPNGWNEKGFINHEAGDDLDIPGAELDDAAEDIGSEDEENNYYSLSDNNDD